MDKNKIAVDTYDKIAKDYSNAYFEDKLDLPYIDMFLGKVNKPDQSILDVGCGPGNFTKYMFNKGFKVEGVDLSVGMLDIAKSKVPEAKFTLGDMRKLKYKSGSFDALLVAYSLIHIPSEEILSTLIGFKRVLIKDGIILIITQAGEADRIVDEPFLKGEKMFINFFTRKRIADYLKNAGFFIIYQKEKQIKDVSAFSNRVIYTIAKKVT
jgi:ubiquinone/menaquinone biosynthesis C-methylase UbiE